MELKSLLMRVTTLEEDLNEFLNQEQERYIALKQEQYKIEEEEGENDRSLDFKFKAREITTFDSKLMNLRTELWCARCLLQNEVASMYQEEEEEE